MPTSTNESQIQEISTSRQTIIETSNLESDIYHDDDFRSGSHDDHLSALDDLIAFGLQNFDRMKTLVLILAENYALVMLGLCASDGL
jgi:hypothetical protein